MHAVLSCGALRCAGAGCVSSQTGSDTFVASRLSSSPDLELDHPSKKQAASNSSDGRDCTICFMFNFGFQKNSNNFFGISTLQILEDTRLYSSFNIYQKSSFS